MFYLCVDYSSHPEPFAGSWNGEHGPEEDHHREQQGNDRGADYIIQHNNEVADKLRVGWQQGVHGKEQLQGPVLAVEELSALFQLLNEELPEEQEDRVNTSNRKSALLLLWRSSPVL